jgi:toxin FitB
VITIVGIEVGIAATPDPLRRESFERALAGIRAEYRDRITAIGEREALAYLALMAATAIANGWTVVSRNIKYPTRTRALTLNPWEYQA